MYYSVKIMTSKKILPFIVKNKICLIKYIFNFMLIVFIFFQFIISEIALLRKPHLYIIIYYLILIGVDFEYLSFVMTIF